MNSHQRPFTGNVVQRIILIFEDSGPNELKTTKQNTYIPRRFMRVGVVQYDWSRRQRKRSLTCRTECRIQGHTVGLLNPKFKRNQKFGRRLELGTFYWGEDYFT